MISHKKALISGKCPLKTRQFRKPVNAILIRVCFHVGTLAEECWPAEILMCVFVECVSSKVDMSFIRTPTFGVYCTSEEAKSSVRNGSGLVHRIYIYVCVCVCVCV